MYAYSSYSVINQRDFIGSWMEVDSDPRIDTCPIRPEQFAPFWAKVSTWGVSAKPLLPEGLHEQQGRYVLHICFSREQVPTTLAWRYMDEGAPDCVISIEGPEPHGTIPRLRTKCTRCGEAFYLSLYTELGTEYTNLLTSWKES